ncbi:hypothetical protein CA54_41010 [Symmachiella macrocystis]|uniref:Uncharacterized protein n=1 Tax=Symmachiella macrocystis TaxID=2527985 RepID=A0A5C6B9U2_9PLAN|nr:hypothetical protein [Symmachiella macrocystis]TWU08863.1 hypothetical protein CA54_41010 [Symmachiella macrocystis]
MNSDRELEERLSRLQLTTTPALDQQILDAALPASLPPRARRRSAGPLRNFVRLGLVAAIVVAAVIVYWQLPSQSAWAQVKREVRKRPWVHLRTTLPGDVEYQSWAAFDKQLVCNRYGKEVHFENHRLGVHDKYDPRTNTITRTIDISGQSGEGFLAMGKLFQALFRGDTNIQSSLPGVELANPKRNTIKVDGKDWTELTWDIQENGKKVQDVTVRIDPVTNLPTAMTLNSPGMVPPKVTLEIDFPATGPTDIYSGGAPRNAKLVEKKPDAELVKIVEAIKRAIEEFDDHRLLKIVQIADAKWYDGFPMIWWIKGNKMRLDAGIERPDFKLTAIPDGTTNKREWWQQHLEQFWFMPLEVQDGKFFYFNQEKPKELQGKSGPYRFNPVHWPKPRWTKRRSHTTSKSRSIFGYSANLINAAARDDVKVDVQPQSGQPGTILVSITGERVWLDSQKGYMTVRREIGSADNPEKVWKPHYSEIVESSDKSPRGFWHPTRMRLGGLTQENGKEVPWESVVQLYYDFDAEIPDSLFQPLDHVIVD